MRFVIALVLVLLTAPVAGATETKADNPREPERVRANVTQTATEESQLLLEPVRIENQSHADDAAVQDMPRRGSFWWVVGAIVVAGIILAVVL